MREIGPKERRLLEMREARHAKSQATVDELRKKVADIKPKPPKPNKGKRR